MPDRAKSILMIMFSLVFILFNICGCTGTEDALPPEGEEGGAITIYGLPQGVQTMNLEEIKTLPAISGEAAAMDKEGNEHSLSYEGPELGSLLEKFGSSKKQFEGVRLTAVDGYSVELPADVLAGRDVILAYLLDGKETQGGLQSVVPGETAIYWVRELAEIQLLTSSGIEPAEQLTLIEDILPAIGPKMFMVDGNEEIVININDILHIDQKTRVFLLATDGLCKAELLNTDRWDYYVQLSGEEAPVFFSPGLPKSMSVRNLAAIIGKRQAFLFLSAFGNFPVKGSKVLSLLDQYLEEGDLILSLSSGKRAVARNDFKDKVISVIDGRLMIE